eukprot:COSAG02_NODE_21594_length_782_cov_0.875549_2_plen_191_part_00
MGWRALNESPFLTHHLRLAQREHGYTEGAQHCRRSRYRISVGDTSVFFLQSKAARQKWPVTPEALEDIQTAFTSKHNTDRKGSGSSDADTQEDTGGGGDAPVGDVSSTQQVQQTSREDEQVGGEQEQEERQGTGVSPREAVKSSQHADGPQSAKSKAGGKKRKLAKREKDARKKGKKKKRKNIGVQVVTG